MREEMAAEMERVRRSLKAELVPYRHSTEIVRVRHADDERHSRRIPVERDDDVT
jgi:hypothetical protein